MKFGGSSFATRAHIGPVCDWIVSRLQQGGSRHRVVCVVSAPSGLTEQYRDTLLSLNPTPSDRLIDAALPLADSLGAVMVAAALQARGVTATVTFGNQVGLRTDRNFTRARLLDVELENMQRELETHQVILVPGGQASAHDTAETTWMGKNSSDMSAIALAQAFGCEELEIYSDVPGVYSCDPNIVPESYLLTKMSHQQAVAMSVSGAKVLHHRGVAHAMEHGLRIVCRGNHGEFGTGTVLETGSTPLAAIIPDARSQVFAGNGKEVARGAEQLELADVPHFVLNEVNQSPKLVITCGFFDAPHFLLAERKLALSEINARLITAMLADGSVIRELVAPEALAQRAREMHAQYCSPPAGQASGQTKMPAEAARASGEKLSQKLSIWQQAEVSHV